MGYLPWRHLRQEALGKHLRDRKYQVGLPHGRPRRCSTIDQRSFRLHSLEYQCDDALDGIISQARHRELCLRFVFFGVWWIKVHILYRGRGRRPSRQPLCRIQENLRTLGIHLSPPLSIEGHWTAILLCLWPTWPP